MTQKSQLVGYLRKKRGSLTISLDLDTLRKLTGTECNGRQFITLFSNAEKVNQILNQDREVTSVCYLKEDV